MIDVLPLYSTLKMAKHFHRLKFYIIFKIIFIKS